MNDQRITRTMHETSLRLVEALADTPTDPRVRHVAHVLVQLAEYIDRSSALKTTLERRGYDAVSFGRQLDDARDNGPILDDLTHAVVQIRSNVTDFATERARRRGPQYDTGA